jgi:mannose-6-phosphate isomerase-like protein (cupin superfamily)
MTTEPGIIRRPGMARTIEVGGFTVTVHAEQVDTAGQFSLIETGDTQIGAGPPLHIHRDATESFYVLEGAYVMVVDGREVTCEAGSFIVIPRGAPHTFRNAAVGSRKLNLYTPAAMVGYFDELGAAIAAGTDEAALEDLARRYQMEVVGEVPTDYLEPGER